MRLTAVAAGLPARRGWSMFDRSPVRTGLVALTLAVPATLTWPVALVLGFFITGPVGAGATWCWIGLVVAVVTATWTARIERRPAGVARGRRAGSVAGT